MSDQDVTQAYTWGIFRQRMNLLFSGMIGLALIVLQAFISIGLSDPASFISVLAFALVLPIMAACLYLINDPRRTNDEYLPVTPPGANILLVGGGGIFIGLIAALWHLSWIIGVVGLISGLVAGAMLIFYTRHLVQE